MYDLGVALVVKWISYLASNQKFQVRVLARAQSLMYMKKLFGVFLLVSLLVIPVFAFAQDPIVPCGGEGQAQCGIADIGRLFLNIFNFIVVYVSIPLAGLGIVIGGVLIMISGGPGGANPITGIASPNMYSKGKTIITGSILGILLIWTSYLIMNSILQALGYVGV